MQLDYLTAIHSPMHTWDARWKLAFVGMLIFVVASAREYTNLIVLYLFALGLIVYSKIPLSSYLKSLKPLFLILIMMIPLLSLTSGGTILTQWGFLTIYKEGLHLSGMVTLRACTIISLSIIIFSSTKLPVLVQALSYFRIPKGLCFLLIVTYRYIFLYLDKVDKLITAAKLRGYTVIKGIRHIKNTTAILVTLLVRSYDQSERIYQAMQLRGFTGSFPVTQHFKTTWQDIAKAGIIFACLVSILSLEIL